MKHFLPFLLFILLSLSVKATHQMGVDISYECTGPCTYRIYHKSYYDCGGAAMATFLPPMLGTAPTAAWANLTGGFNISSPAGCAPPAPIGGWVLEGYSEVTPLCPDALNPPPGTPHPTRCDPTNPTATINGVAELVYYRDYSFCNIPAACDSFLIEWGSCCRNSTINSGAADEGMYTGSTVIKPTLSPCNSSPEFLNKPVPYICAGQPFTFNQGAYDPDGDSLSYHLGDCMNTVGVPVTYNPGFSPSQPLGPTWAVSINSFTGDITMTPNPVGNQIIGVMCIVVKEWRNGQQIGQVTRDMQITVIPACATSNPLTSGVQNVELGVDEVPANSLSYNEVRTCAGIETCFEIPVLSQDPNLDYQIYWNEGIAGATFSDASNPAILDTVSGATPVAKFCWTPPVGTDGAFFFVVSVKDDACPIPGFNQFTIIVYVEDVLVASTASAVPIGCNEMEFVALPSSTIPSPYANVFNNYQWSGNGNILLNPNVGDSSFTHLYPSPNTYFYNLTLQDTFGCKVTLGGIANLTTGVVADAGPDVTICSNYNFNLGTPALPGLSYSWTPNTALNNPNIAQPGFTLPNGGLSQNTINYVLTVTDGICTTHDYVTVTVNPSLQTNILPSTPKICVGQSINLQAVGNLGVGTGYLWSTGATTASITVSPTVTTTYSVITFNNGCSSDQEFVTVEVQQGPPAQIAGDIQICPGETTTLTAFGGISYLWSANSWTNPVITLANITQDSTLSVIAFDSQGCPGLPATTTVRTYPKPQAAFSTPPVCEGTESVFTDISALSEGAITQWFWDFGDGTTASQQNPIHGYGNAGTYLVKLVVSTSNGCKDSITQSVTIDPMPEPDFNFTSVCEGLPNIFTDATSIGNGGTIASLTWNFGDGSPVVSGGGAAHVFPSYGYYQVTLTAVSGSGCATDFTRTVFVNPNPIADFRVESACQDSVVFTSNSSVVAGSLDYIQAFQWNFDDPTSGNANISDWSSPWHVYQTAGIYTISLTVTTGNGCSDQIVRDVNVYPEPVANFTYEDNCANENTRFIDISTTDPATPVREWHWNFGFGWTANGYSPQNNFTSVGPGTYPVVFAIKTNENCVDTVVKNIVINPVPYLDFASTRECLEDTTRFTNQTTLASGSVLGYFFDFGDGSTSTLPDPTHRYLAPGNYIATLSAVSDSGCTSLKQREVIVYPLPEIIRINPDTACFSEQATLAVIAAPEVSIEWYYNLNDEQPFYTGNSYTTTPLPYQTTFYVMPRSEFGCVNDRQPIVADVFPDQELELVPSTKETHLPLALVDFHTASNIGLVSWEWNFGDGNTSDQVSPSHEYHHPGKYEVVVKTVDINGCERSDNEVIEVLKLTGVYLPNAFSPNQDGFNDTYKMGYYNLSNFRIQIFNRWGQMVFSSDNPDFEWDGSNLSGTPVQEGVYVYVMKARDFDGIDIEESRTITVLR
ncbi:MAG: PKD domain-containing protein [Bacteroidia bacterium]|nr:PKD domain-containing protein [Bacteroidia bacterium]